MRLLLLRMPSSSTEQELRVHFPPSLEPALQQPPPPPSPCSSPHSMDAESAGSRQQGSLKPCITLGAWDTSHFSADDWVPIANGQRPTSDTLWRWVTAGQGDRGYLLSKSSGGHLNSRPGGFVRGHGNEEKPPRRPAGRLSSSLLVRHPIPLERYASATETRDCSWASAGVTYYTLRFERLGGYLHVEEDGGLAAHKAECSDDLHAYSPSRSPPPTASVGC